MASVCSIRQGIPHDDASTLAAGSHAFIQHESYLAYRHMCVEQAEHVATMIAQHVWHPHAPFTEGQVAQLVLGVCRSKLTPRVFKGLFGCT